MPGPSFRALDGRSRGACLERRLKPDADVKVEVEVRARSEGGPITGAAFEAWPIRGKVAGARRDRFGSSREGTTVTPSSWTRPKVCPRSTAQFDDPDTKHHRKSSSHCYPRRPQPPSRPSSITIQPYHSASRPSLQYPPDFPLTSPSASSTGVLAPSSVVNTPFPFVISVFT